METEQFSLCWNNYQNNLTSGFQDLLKDEDLVDVTLAAEGRYIKAHKTVLSICSPYFKELFRANPCKHPIVILHEIKYEAISALLQFMYQGEVSVNQDEIPSFMRVAEILKVKGLTENSNLSGIPETSNGIPNSTSQSIVGVDRQPIMKRNRPIKKMIKPMQQLKPMEFPNTSSSPMNSPPSIKSPPPAKQPRMEDSRSASDYLEPLVTPKQEPVDYSESDYRDTHNYDDKVDFNSISTMNSMMSSSMDSKYGGESSDLYNSSKYNSDPSSPGGILFLKSRKGHPVLIHNGHMYTLSHKVDNRSMWVCVKQRPLNCGGCVTTANGPTLLSYSGHNHSQLNDVITRLQAASCSPSPELL